MRSILGLLALFVTTELSMAAAPPVTSYSSILPGAIAVVAEVRAKPGKERELREITLPLVAKVRAERNNVLYFLHEDRESAGHFVFYEIFATPADFEAHNASSHVQSWFARLSELADGGVKVSRLQILDPTRK